MLLRSVNRLVLLLSSRGALDDGIWTNFPWTAFLALFGALLAAAAMAGIVIAVDGQSVSSWNLQPAVLLAVASAAANILLHYALTRGVTVAWWVKSLKPGTRMADLQNMWAYGTSFKDALIAGPSINVVAVAGLLVAISPINAPLLQRAVVVSRSSVSSTATLTIPAALEFPQGYTGVITGRGQIVTFTTANFSNIARDYNAGKVLNVSNSGCLGTCKGLISAAGYAMTCNESTLPFNINPGQLSQNNTMTAQTSKAYNGTDVFSSNFTYSETGADGPTFKFTTMYKQDAGCNGTLHMTTCSLKPAIMIQHVVLTNDSIALDDNYNHEDDQVKQYTSTVQNSAQGDSTHGGLALALNLQYQSTAHTSFAGAVGYSTSVSGYPAIQFATNGLPALFGCDTIWSNPTKTMLNTARQLAFRVAITAANVSNATNVQRIHATQIDDVTIFESHYAYLGASLVFTFLAGIFVLPLFLGWWHLGRQVSLSPIEIAKAFDAPCLAGAKANSNGRQLLNEIGDRPVIYGPDKLGAEEQTMRMGSPQELQRVDINFVRPRIVHVGSPASSS